MSGLAIPVIDPLGIIVNIHNSLFPTAPFYFEDVVGKLFGGRSYSVPSTGTSTSSPKTAQNAERWEIVRGKTGEMQGIVVHREIKY